MYVCVCVCACVRVRVCVHVQVNKLCIQVNIPTNERATQHTPFVCVSGHDSREPPYISRANCTPERSKQDSDRGREGGLHRETGLLDAASRHLILPALHLVFLRRGSRQVCCGTIPLVAMSAWKRVVLCSTLQRSYI